jgi:HlyD family secretion protein
VALVVAAAATLGASAYYVLTEREAPPQVTTAAVTRGDIRLSVGATGTLEALTTVQVGTQVSGTVLSLGADYNSIVRRGQVVARLDPSLFQTQVDQARANVTKAEADLERLKLIEAEARRKYDQARELARTGLTASSEVETAEASSLGAAASVRSAEAQLTQARASLQQAAVNLEKTVITSPIDGIVIARNVDVGQTVAASLQAPTLFVIAADLTKMRVNASVHEADVGVIRPGQSVRFNVDAYPTIEFPGTVSLVRLNPVVSQNVVTYATVIDVPNPDLKLKPGMTATVEIRLAERHDVLRVPSAAVRFRPTAAMLAALGGTMPAPAGRGAAAGATSPSAGAREAAAPDLFSPLETGETGGQIWQYENGALRAVRVRLGITDETWTELVDPELAEGALVVTGVTLSGATESGGRPQTPATNNPLMGPQRPGGPGGGRPQGGR